MTYVPHPDQEPLVRRPAREEHKGLDDESERNFTGAQEPTGQGSDVPGFGMPKPADQNELDQESTPRNVREARHDSEIEPGGPMSEEARQQLEQNIVPRENYP